MRPLTKYRLFLHFISFFYLSFTPLVAISSTQEKSRYATYKKKYAQEIQSLERCSWLVMYKGHIYDLSPLTRKSLDHPIKGDLRAVLETVPTAKAHLQRAFRHNQNATIHAGWATLSLVAFAGAQVVHARKKGSFRSSLSKPVSIFTSLLFLGSTIKSWQLKSRNKKELALAIDAFNKESKEPILPYQGE